MFKKQRLIVEKKQKVVLGIIVLFCLLSMVGYFSFGSKVLSKDVKYRYSYKDGKIILKFDLINGKVLRDVNSDKTFFDSQIIEFRQYPKTPFYTHKQLTYCFEYPVEIEGKEIPFTDRDLIILNFEDREERIVLKEIAEKLDNL